MALLTAILTAIIAALRAYPLLVSQSKNQRESDAASRRQEKDQRVDDALDLMS